MTHPEAATEVVLTKTQARPKVVRLGKYRPWRWQVTLYQTRETNHGGVWDGRVHLHGQHGYCFTRWGAAIAASKHFAKVNESIDDYIDRI